MPTRKKKPIKVSEQQINNQLACVNSDQLRKWNVVLRL